MTARPLYLWARVGAGSWGAVQPAALRFTCPNDAERVAARYRAAYPNLKFTTGETPPIGAEHEKAN